MRFLLVALLCALSYAQTGKCALNSEVVVREGSVYLEGLIRGFPEDMVAVQITQQMEEEVLGDGLVTASHDLVHLIGNGPCPGNWREHHCIPESIVRYKTSGSIVQGKVVAVTTSGLQIHANDFNSVVDVNNVDLLQGSEVPIPCRRHCSCVTPPEPTFSPTERKLVQMTFTQNIIGDGMVCNGVGPEIMSDMMNRFFVNISYQIDSITTQECRIDKLNNENNNRWTMEILTYAAMQVYDMLTKGGYDLWVLNDLPTDSPRGMILEGIGNFTSNDGRLELDFNSLRPFVIPDKVCTDRQGYAPIENERISCLEAATRQLIGDDRCDNMMNAVCCASCNLCSQFIDTLADRSRCPTIVATGRCDSIPGCERHCCLAKLVQHPDHILKQVTLYHIIAYSLALCCFTIICDRCGCNFLICFYHWLCDPLPDLESTKIVAEKKPLVNESASAGISPEATTPILVDVTNPTSEPKVTFESRITAPPSGKKMLHGDSEVITSPRQSLPHREPRRQSITHRKSHKYSHRHKKKKKKKRSRSRSSQDSHHSHQAPTQFIIAAPAQPIIQGRVQSTPILSTAGRVQVIEGFPRYSASTTTLLGKPQDLERAQRHSVHYQSGDGRYTSHSPYRTQSGEQRLPNLTRMSDSEQAALALKNMDTNDREELAESIMFDADEKNKKKARHFLSRMGTEKRVNLAQSVLGLRRDPSDRMRGAQSKEFVRDLLEEIEGERSSARKQRLVKKSAYKKKKKSPVRGVQLFE